MGARFDRCPLPERTSIQLEQFVDALDYNLLPRKIFTGESQDQFMARMAAERQRQWDEQRAACLCNGTSKSEHLPSLELLPAPSENNPQKSVSPLQPLNL